MFIITFEEKTNVYKIFNSSEVKKIIYLKDSKNIIFHLRNENFKNIIQFDSQEEAESRYNELWSELFEHDVTFNLGD